MFNKWFGGKKEEPVVSTQTALQKLQEQEDMLLKKHDYLQAKVDAELAIAKAHGTKNKALALSALKRKKQYQTDIDQVDRILNTIQEQRSSLENASMNSEILQVMSQSSKALKHAHKQMNADQVHDLMDDIAEQRDIANEIATAIAPPISSTLEDGDLLKELEDLADDAVEKELLDIEGEGSSSRLVDKLPRAPTDVLPSASKAVAAKAGKKKQADDEDLAELEAWANA